MKILLAAVLAASPALAQDEDSDWTKYQPPTTPPPIGTPQTPEGGFSTPERDRLDSWLHSKLLDKICKNVKPRYGLGGESLAGEFERSLLTRPDGGLALEDAVELKAGVGKALTNGQGLGIYLAARVEGSSYVVRPLKSKEPCEEIDSVLKLQETKTVLPFKGERIADMMVGELWRIPFTLNYIQAPSLADALGDRGSWSVSFTRNHGASASMTVRRLSEKQTRFRLRIDRVVIKTTSIGAAVTVPALEFAMNAENILTKLIEKEISRQLARHVSAWMSYSKADGEGNRVVLEFLIDPTVPEEAAALAAAMNGDLDELMKGAARMSTLGVNQETTLQMYDRVRREHNETLGTAQYAAVNQYDHKTRSFGIGLPFFMQRNVAALFGRDKITPQHGEDTEFRFYRAGDSKQASFFDVPWLGHLTKDNSYFGAETVTAGVPGQPHGEPILVYSANHDFLRLPASTVKGSIQEMNSVLALAGARRGAGRSLVLPAEKLVPPPPPERQADPDRNLPEWSDRKGALSLTVVLNQRAARDAVSASAADILEAVHAAAAADMTQITGWLVKNGRVEGGKIVYDREAARRDLGDHVHRDLPSELADLSKQTAALLADFAWIRSSSSNEERAERTARVVAAQGSSRLPYDQVLKIMIQYVDPLDMTGDFVANIQGVDRKAPRAAHHLVLKKDRAEVPLLVEAGQTKQRFAEPTRLTD